MNPENPEMSMNRRTFLAATIAAAVPASAAQKRIDRSRVSAITDEVARSPEDAIRFAHEFGLQWLSLRDTPSPLAPVGFLLFDGTGEAEAGRDRVQGRRNKISFLDTPFLKFDLPGTEPKRTRPEELASQRGPHRQEPGAVRQAHRRSPSRYPRQSGLQLPDASHFYVHPRPRTRVFSSRIADLIGEYAAIAEKEGIRLLIENEASQNAGTSAETAKLLKILPRNVGINWDSLNGVPLGEKPFPDGYESVQKDRIWNVHVKGKSLLDYPEHQDWPAILTALKHDGFTGRLELETHIFGDQQVAASHDSMKEIVRLLEP